MQEDFILNDIVNNANEKTLEEGEIKKVFAEAVKAKDIMDLIKNTSLKIKKSKGFNVRIAYKKLSLFAVPIILTKLAEDLTTDVINNFDDVNKEIKEVLRKCTLEETIKYMEILSKK